VRRYRCRPTVLATLRGSVQPTKNAVKLAPVIHQRREDVNSLGSQPDPLAVRVMPLPIWLQDSNESRIGQVGNNILGQPVYFG
jgi:hypothetical protein